MRAIWSSSCRIRLARAKVAGLWALLNACMAWFCRAHKRKRSLLDSSPSSALVHRRNVSSAVSREITSGGLSRRGPLCDARKEGGIVGKLRGIEALRGDQQIAGANVADRERDDERAVFDSGEERSSYGRIRLQVGQHLEPREVLSRRKRIAISRLALQARLLSELADNRIPIDADGRSHRFSKRCPGTDNQSAAFSANPQPL